MSSQIKGLSQFIADLRASTSQEAERARVQAELASVRKKIAASRSGKDFGSKSKNGYEYRKVVSKLLYIYILGYDVDLGSEEVNALLQMPKFAEKQVGYLALEILLHAQNDLKSQVESIVIQDLRSTKEVLTSLALNYVSTWDANHPVSDNLTDLIYQLMVSPTSSTAVIKKAALTFLNFYRHDPERFQKDSEWPLRVERICSLVGGPNLGIVTSLVSLLTEIARTDQQVFNEQSFSLILRRLEEVFDGDTSKASDYKYYQIYAPWLLAKLCRLLGSMYALNLPPDMVDAARKLTASIITYCVDDYDGADITINGDTSGQQQHKNACNIVFYDAVLLGKALDVYHDDPKLAPAILSIVEELLTAKDTNMRYFALEVLQVFDYNLIKSAGDGLSDKLTEVVLKLLKDRDISVRRQALDGLLRLVDHGNVEAVAAELLDLLVASDLLIRPLMVARLAVLIERFATSHEWYFDTCITLLEIGGTYVGGEVWQRLVQVVVNNEALQPYAVKRIYDVLSNAENTKSRAISVNPAVYSQSLVKLGAFILGEFAAKYPGDPMNLFLVLQDHIGSVQWDAKVILLNAYLKFAAKFPEMRPAIADAIMMYTESPNLEIQQRANEYLRLLHPANLALLPVVSAGIPPFGVETTTQLFQKMEQPANNAVVLKPQMTRSATQDSSSQARLQNQHTDNANAPALRQLYLSSNWEFGFRRMLTNSEAILFQDALLQIGCRYEFIQAQGKIVLYLKNFSTFDISTLNVQIKNPMSDDILQVQALDPISGSTLAAGQTVEQIVFCEAKQPFALTPICRISYLAGGFFETSFKLPIVLERFMSPSAITYEQFSQRWDQVGAEVEFTKQFRNYSASRAAKNVENDADIVKGMQYGLVTGNNVPRAVLGAGIIHTSRGGMLGSLIVVQPDAERENYRVTVRVTKKKLAAVVLANNFAHAYQL